MGNPLQPDWNGVNLNDPEAVLHHAFELYGSQLALACSFSLEDVTLLHMAAKIDRRFRVFALDTGRLPPETYECAEAIRDRYDIDVEWFFPPQQQTIGLCSYIAEKKLHFVVLLHVVIVDIDCKYTFLAINSHTIIAFEHQHRC